MASPLQQLEPRRKPLFTCPGLVLGHRFYPLLVFDERPQALGRVVPQGEPMPKYMTIVKGSENHAPPPPALLEGIDKLIKDAGKRMVGVGGLLPSGNGARARLGLRGGDPGDDGMRTSSPPILPQALLAACHHRRREQAADTAAHHGGDRAEELGRNPGFQLAELRSAHEEDHVDPGHPAT